ncbi:MAG: hypothetical protein ABL901_14810 [Hyphomicrobiaceae bacterium]
MPMPQPSKQITSGGPNAMPKPPETVELGDRASGYNIDEPSLRDRVADEVLKLFKLSLRGTLALACVILVFDYIFIAAKVITPEQRLMTEKVLMTLIGATVVQVGAALAAIVFAVFKTEASSSE